jgi:hypothetical protein
MVERRGGTISPPLTERSAGREGQVGDDLLLGDLDLDSGQQGSHRVVDQRSVSHDSSFVVRVQGTKRLEARRLPRR